MVSLEALHAILKTGNKIKEREGLDSNPFVDLIEQADGAAALERLQESSNDSVFKKVFAIISTYFPYEEDEPVAAEGPTAFGAEAPQGGFKFN
ncbi:Importin subunit alpha, related [Eimeria tenella]|uniref:Importin subunit alpha, related n=1 Tax=Eimeria tenella TaxID=5802 RepID=U6L8R0_EIMTE|nr:Importin subunit alpha, related [Eimeria tenella]CDJ44185.1 Importin subunit alpha, related [Eimeria tenella]|eukprot:XP_013234934.1 Importin subunit alpha, related [Eimeria tenella]